MNTAAEAHHRPETTAIAVLGALSFCHFLNDMMQSLLPAMYPMLKTGLALDFGQIGLITLVYQVTASLFQPLVGMYTDKRPLPYALACGMGFTLVGLVLLSKATSFPVLLLSASVIGIGSSIFHPESSRLARLASGGRHGFAQSLFQVGGNAGSAVGPLAAAFIVLPNGQGSVAWFALAAMLGIGLLTKVGGWYVRHNQRQATTKRPAVVPTSSFSRGRVIVALAILVALIFSKYFYLASFSSYYTFYLIHKFDVSVWTAQVHLFVFLASVAAGTFLGGPIGDRIGRKYVIWFSILGALPFALAMPYAGLVSGAILVACAGFILSSATAAIIVFAQELMPHRVGMITGIFFGFSFGVGGLGAAALGRLADSHGIAFVFTVCSFLPAMGLIGFLLPNMPRVAKA